MLCAMVLGTAVVIFAGGRSESARPAPPLPEPSHERPWLTPEAAGEIAGADRMLGPLFNGVEIGGRAPSAIDRSRIAAFARAHDVDIQLDVVAGTLTGVRFAVTYGGCCGYEGADVLARRLGRPSTANCCGCEGTWLDDWAVVSEDHRVHMRGKVRVNQVEVTWTQALSLPEMLDRADGLIGSDGEGGVVEMPYPVLRSPEQAAGFGVTTEAEDGRISGVVIALREGDIQAESNAGVNAILRARFGRPRIDREGTRTWRTASRIITQDSQDLPTTLTIRRR